MRFGVGLTLFVMAGVCVAQPTTVQQAAGPYVRAIELVKTLSQTPDGDLIDTDTPLDARTAAFLEKNATIFSLLQEGAGGDQTEWGGETGDLQAMMPRLSGIRSLANLSVLRAKMLQKEGKQSEAIDQLVDVIALGRNITREAPVMIVFLVSIGVDEVSMQQIARHLPSLTPDVTRQLSDRIKQLPQRASAAQLVRGEQQFGATQLAQSLKGDAAKAMQSLAPFYTAIEAAFDEKPALSKSQFQQKLTEAVGKIEGDKNAVPRLLAQTLLPSWTAFYSTLSVNHIHQAMLQTALEMQIDGANSVETSVDPFGDGPFEIVRDAKGFELRSKLTDRAGKQASMRFGP